ncbi:ROK family protein [Halobacillus ihumii]|uniref:ROK family protein n=1 Tax=Halobacillus ihumii TaxID=2686092 RepID=UPI0013D65FF2|nr:ROK family protein [Halobacillus ihumii]
MLLGSIEAGGTKFVCTVANEKGEIINTKQFKTERPEITMGNVKSFFSNYNMEAIGIGTFGPADINKNSKTYGYITSTPKREWINYPILDEMKKTFDIPIGFNTDVNVSALGESIYGAAKGLNSCLYMTVGTGVGAGAVINGQLLEGLTHPEMGHITVGKHKDDPFDGACPYHHNCLEGMASGVAIEQRWDDKGTNLSNNKKVWVLEAFYLAQGIATYILILSPKKVILGGGVIKQKQLLPQIQKNVQKILNDYLQFKELSEDIDNYIVTPGIEGLSGALGGIELAKRSIHLN